MMMIVHGPDDNDWIYLSENENSRNVPNVCEDEENKQKNLFVSNETQANGPKERERQLLE